jgi:tetratricopeptide (TPR) repeat protein
LIRSPIFTIFLGLILSPYTLIAGGEYLDSLLAVADSCYDVGSYQSALGYYQKALDIQLKEPGVEHFEVGSTYEKFGKVYEDIGDYQQALNNYEKALEIKQKVLEPDDVRLADGYINIGTLYFELGEYQLALENYRKALEIREKRLGTTHPDVGWVCNLIGCTYLELGDYLLAQEYLNRSLRIMDPTDPNTASIYNNLGMVYKSSGENEKTRENFKKALQIYKSCLGILPPTRTDVTILLYTYIGHVYFELDEYELALVNYNKALNLQSAVLGPMHPEVAVLHASIGNVYTYMGEHLESLECHKKALEIWLASLGPDNPLVGEAYSAMGKEAFALGQKVEALTYLENSIEIFERSRGKIESAELRASYTETVSKRYEAIINLLIQMGRPKEAFQYLERSKSKALKDALDKEFLIGLGHGAIEEKLAESKRLATKVDVLENQLLTEQQKPDSLRNEVKVANLSHLLAKSKKEYFRVAAQIQADLDYAFAVRVHPTDIGVLRKDLPAGQKLLMAYSGERELYLFLVSLEGYEVRTVSVERDSLENLISLCRALCGVKYAQKLHEKGKLLAWSWADDGSQFYVDEVKLLKEVLSTLNGYLIEPFEQELSDAEIITFVPSGQLYYVPWGALLDTEGDSLVFLSERYSWNVLTSTELLQCILRREEDRGAGLETLVLVGNPVGANLPSTEEEVVSIKYAYPNSTVLTGLDATEIQVVSSTSGSEALHLATHCILDTENPWDSYIHLTGTDSADGRWTATEISGQSWNRMQLVTLSACETAMGGRRPGLEFESMAKAFSLAMEGPPSIVATLWPVADESTKELMVTFYEELRDISKAEALRKAQQELIHSDKFAHPFFWAPFILIGEWR